MEVNQTRIEKVLKDIENAEAFFKLHRFPNSFYRLNEEEQKRVAEIYKRKKEGNAPPFKETT